MVANGFSPPSPISVRVPPMNLGGEWRHRVVFYWAPYDGREGPAAEYAATLGKVERARLIEAVRAAYLDGESDGPRSYAALAWAVRGLAPE